MIMSLRRGGRIQSNYRIKPLIRNIMTKRNVGIQMNMNIMYRERKFMIMSLRRGRSPQMEHGNFGIPPDRETMHHKSLTNASHLEQNAHHHHHHHTGKIAACRSDKIESNLFLQIKDICTHNANAAVALGQSGKGDVWNLLAGIVDNMSSGAFDDFDGWKGFSGGALGRDLLQNVLRYYEAQGDVQMLATIFCVFNAGKDRTSYGTSNEVAAPSSPLHILLPDEDTVKYDAYLNLYGRLLYGWGQLNVRAELNKHLRSLPRVFEEYFSPADNPWNNNEGGPSCPRCLKPANPETNVCHYCGDYAFRCAICTNAVRGLFTICMACGHGGHVEHMMAWFTERTVCPSGCGCLCTLNTFGSPRDQNTMTLERERRLFAGKAVQKGLSSQSPAGLKSSQLGRSEDFSFGSLPYGAYCSPIYSENRSGSGAHSQIRNLQF